MLRRIVLSVVALGFSFIGFSQELEVQSKDLKSSLNDLIEDSRSYGNYKAVNTESLQNFSKQLSDSIKKFNNRVNLLNAEKYDLINQKEVLEAKVEEVNAKLIEKDDQVNNLTVMGVPFNKSSFSITTISLILLLTLALITSYVIFKQWYYNGKSSQKEAEKLTQELSELRELKLEKEIRLKRELQTALNKLDSLKSDGVHLNQN